MSLRAAPIARNMATTTIIPISASSSSNQQQQQISRSQSQLISIPPSSSQATNQIRATASVSAQVKSYEKLTPEQAINRLEKFAALGIRSSASNIRAQTILRELAAKVQTLRQACVAQNVPLAAPITPQLLEIWSELLSKMISTVLSDAAIFAEFQEQFKLIIQAGRREQPTSTPNPDTNVRSTQPKTHTADYVSNVDFALKRLFQLPINANECDEALPAIRYLFGISEPKPKPLNGFFRFLAEFRKENSAKGRKKGSAGVSKDAGTRWNSMSDAEKNRYMLPDAN